MEKKDDEKEERKNESNTKISSNDINMIDNIPEKESKIKEEHKILLR